MVRRAMLDVKSCLADAQSTCAPMCSAARRLYYTRLGGDRLAGACPALHLSDKQVGAQEKKEMKSVEVKRPADLRAVNQTRATVLCEHLEEAGGMTGKS